MSTTMPGTDTSSTRLPVAASLLTPAELDAISATSEWYVTAHTVRSKMLSGHLVEFPGSQAHAKRMGTLLTACGEWSYSWRKIYDLPFPLPRTWRYAVESCPVCLEVVVSESQP